VLKYDSNVFVWVKTILLRLASASFSVKHESIFVGADATNAEHAAFVIKDVSVGIVISNLPTSA
jgi:hypothetical protein